MTKKMQKLVDKEQFLRKKYQEDLREKEMVLKFETVNKENEKQRMMQEVGMAGGENGDQLEEGVDKEDFFHGMN